LYTSFLDEPLHQYSALAPKVGLSSSKQGNICQITIILQIPNPTSKVIRTPLKTIALKTEKSYILWELIGMHE